MGIKVDSARKEMILLNEDFRNKKAFSPKGRKEIYHQLIENRKVDLSKSVLITWLPEGDDFYSGGVIDQYGQIFWFDINVKNNELTEWDNDCLLPEYENTQYFKVLKPWDYKKLAIEIWHELHNQT